jgi:hypothetical protein
MNIATQWRVSTVALAAGIVLLAGCAPASSPSSGESETPASTKTPTPSAVRTPTPIAAASGADADVVDLPFGPAEERVTGDWVVGWLPPFAADDARFSDESPDDPATVDYLDNQNGCKIAMGGARLADKVMPDADTVISDGMITSWLFGDSASDADVESISSAADVAVLWQRDQLATVDFRVWSGTADDGRTAFVVARGFGDMAAGIYLTIECPAGADSLSEYHQMVDQYARVFIRSSTDK